MRRLVQRLVVVAASPSRRRRAPCRTRCRASPRRRRPPRPARRRSRARAPPCRRGRAPTRAVWTTLPPSRRRTIGVSACEASSWTSPSLGAPTKPLVASRERAVERGVDRLRVVAVGRVRRRDRVGGDEHRVAGRDVDGRASRRRRCPRRRRRCRSRSGRSGRRAVQASAPACRGFGLSSTCISTRVPVGSVTYSVSILYLPLFAVAVTLQAMPPVSLSASTV